VSRTVIRRLDQPRRTRRRVDGALMLAFAVLVLFAIIGLVSAGMFVAGKVSGSGPARSAGQTKTRSSSVALAHSQATAIVTAAQYASRSIVNNATARGKRRAAAIITAAQRRARQILARAQTAPTPVPTAGTQSSGGATTPVSPPVVQPTPGVSVATPVVSGPPPTPTFQGAPASWQVIVYGATFGHGPGNAGSIYVYNRGAGTFSGIAGVRYARGGSSSAPFTIGPHQTLVLPLNGAPYPGGNWQMYLSNLR